LDLIRNHQNTHDVAFFIDPPYTAGGKNAGKRLYDFYEINHSELFEISSQLVGEFLMTYSNNENTREMADQHNFETREIAMRNTHNAKKTELLIGRDLGWFDL
jgi:DNA adenine methylase